MLSYGILERDKNTFVFKHSFPYSGDVKPVANLIKQLCSKITTLGS